MEYVVWTHYDFQGIRVEAENEEEARAKAAEVVKQEMPDIEFPFPLTQVFTDMQGNIIKEKPTKWFNSYEDLLDDVWEAADLAEDEEDED